MKKDIHPTYYPHATVTCACGATFTTGSTAENIRVELCNNCHPFYTGKQKFVDTARRVEKFQEAQEKTKKIATQRKGRKVKRTTRTRKQKKETA